MCLNKGRNKKNEVNEMVEFCDECGGMMFTSRHNNKKILNCNSCNATKPLDDDVIKKYQYIIKTEPLKNQKLKG